MLLELHSKNKAKAPAKREKSEKKEKSARQTARTNDEGVKGDDKRKNERAKSKEQNLPVRELNPGHPRDRQVY